MVNDLDCQSIEFPVSNKDYFKIEQKNIISINVFCILFKYHIKNLKTVYVY